MIVLKNDYEIVADNNQYILRHKTVPKSGKIYYSIIGYYTQLAGALRGYLNDCIKVEVSKSEHQTIHEILDLIHELSNYINEEMGDV